MRLIDPVTLDKIVLLAKPGSFVQMVDAMHGRNTPQRKKNMRVACYFEAGRGLIYAGVASGVAYYITQVL